MHVRRRVHEGVPEECGPCQSDPALQGGECHGLVQVGAPSLGNEMSGNPNYTEYQPKPYRRPMPMWWWVENRAYLSFVVRELTSVFVGFLPCYLFGRSAHLGRGPKRTPCLRIG